MEKIAAFLKKNGINPSTPRMRIYEFLYSNRNHPTVDVIYSALSPEMPTLSKTTVYNTLRLFVSKGITLVVDVDNNEARYDADLSMHGHFKCISCGGLFDVSINKSDISYHGMDDFQITGTLIQFKGYCRLCAIN